MATISTSTIANSLKETLEAIITDDSDGYSDSVLLNKWLEVKSQDDNWEDDLEVGGPGLAYEKPEGAEIHTGTVKEGPITRYIARTYALKLIATQEAIEDGKYKKVLNLAKRNKRAIYKTADIDATNILIRMGNSAYTSGDEQPLSSTAHPLPHGGTYSNKVATPVSPSKAGFIVHRAMAMQLPGHDGIIEGYELKKVVCPVAQWGVWEGLTQSVKDPTPGAYNEINVVHNSKIEVIPNKYWTTTNLDYVYITDCPHGLQWRWRKRPMAMSWVENDETTVKHATRARWARGWSDARGAICNDYS